MAGLTVYASAQTADTPFYSGIITGPDFCTDRSLGGPVTYPFDSDRDGVADTCSLPRTRRETAARQNAMERLGGELALHFGQLFAQECVDVAETFGEPEKEATDECADPRAAQAEGRGLPAVPPAPIPQENTSDLFFSGPVVKGRAFCLDRSFGGPVTYPFDSDGDGVADICSLPRTRRAAVARQNAYERLAVEQQPRFDLLVVEECLRVPGSFGEPKAEATDVCAVGIPTPTETATGEPLPTPGTGEPLPTPGAGITPTPRPQPPTVTPDAPVATDPGPYHRRAAQTMVLAPGRGEITVGWEQPVRADSGDEEGRDEDPYDADHVFEYIVEYSTRRNMSGRSEVVFILSSPPSQCSSSSLLADATEYECTISGLTDFTTYYVRVRANRGPGFSNPYTPILSITPGLAGPVVWPDGEDGEDGEDGDAPLVSDLYGEIDVMWAPPYGSLPISHYILQWGTSRNLPNSCTGRSNCSQTTVSSGARGHKITGLNNNTTYYVRIQGVTNNGPGTWSTTQSIRLTSNLRDPGQPTDIMLNTAGTGRDLQVRWTAPPVTPNDPEPTHYHVQWRDTTARETWSGSTRQTTVQAPTTTATIKNLSGLARYEVRVQAINARVAGRWSRTAAITLGQAAPPSAIMLDPGNRQISVTWTEPVSVPAAINYIIQWNTSSNFPSNCATAANCDQASAARGTSSHQITELQNNRVYYVRIQSINDNGPGGWSPVTSAEPGTPSAPTSISAQESSENIGSLDVSWMSATEADKPSVTRFRLRWRTVGSTSWRYRTVTFSQSDPDSLDGPTYNYTLTGLTTGRAQEVQVQAVNSYGNGQWGSSVTATPGESFIPTGVNLQVIGSAGDQNLEAQWGQPASEIAVSSYNVQWRTCGTSGSSCGNWGSSRNTDDDSNTALEYPGTTLRNGTYYQARVRSNGSRSTGGSSAYDESPRYLVTIDDNNTPRDRTDDTVSIQIL